MTILQAKQVTKTYGAKNMKQEVLKGIDLSIEAGEFISIMGPSGSGKTTFLNVLSSIDYLTHGSVVLGDQQLEKLSNKALSEIRKKGYRLYLSRLQFTSYINSKRKYCITLIRTKIE
ncbi:ABC-type lipoprotein export system ATPase subunit [Staphylococcus caledonicus]